MEYNMQDEQGVGKIGRGNIYSDKAKETQGKDRKRATSIEDDDGGEAKRQKVGEGSLKRGHGGHKRDRSARGNDHNANEGQPCANCFGCLNGKECFTLGTKQSSDEYRQQKIQIIQDEDIEMDMGGNVLPFEERLPRAQKEVSPPLDTNTMTYRRISPYPQSQARQLEEELHTQQSLQRRSFNPLSQRFDPHHGVQIDGDHPTIPQISSLHQDNHHHPLYPGFEPQIANNYENQPSFSEPRNMEQDNAQLQFDVNQDPLVNGGQRHQDLCEKLASPIRVTQGVTRNITSDIDHGSPLNDNNQCPPKDICHLRQHKTFSPFQSDDAWAVDDFNIGSCDAAQQLLLDMVEQPEMDAHSRSKNRSGPDVGQSYHLDGANESKGHLTGNQYSTATLETPAATDPEDFEMSGVIEGGAVEATATTPQV